MLATQAMKRELAARGVENRVDWTRGVDAALFRPGAPKAQALLGLPRPIHLYVGRVAVEKNIRAFLELALPGSKVVVGDGPQRAELQAAFPERSEEHTSELQSLMRISYAVFCLKKKNRL